MWQKITNGIDFFNLVKNSDPTLDNQETSNCINRGIEFKEAEGFYYENENFDVCLFVYKNFTVDYWIFNYTSNGIFEIEEIGNVIINKIESFIDDKETNDYRIRITTNANPQIIDWIKSNSSDYLNENELEQMFTRGGE